MSPGPDPDASRQGVDRRDRLATDRVTPSPARPLTRAGDNAHCGFRLRDVEAGIAPRTGLPGRDHKNHEKHQNTT